MCFKGRIILWLSGWLLDLRLPMFVWIDFRLHWCAAGMPGHWDRHSAENCSVWTTSAPVPLCYRISPCVADLSMQREVQPVGQGNEVRLRLQAVGKSTVQLPPPVCGALTWWLSQELGISGRPLSLRTLSFMLSTQGCSRTLEPNGGSYSFTSDKRRSKYRVFSWAVLVLRVKGAGCSLRGRSYWLAAHCHCSAWPAPNKAKPVGIFKNVSNVFLSHTHCLPPLLFPSQQNNFHLNPLVHNISNSPRSRVIYNGLWAFQSLLR